MKKWLTLLFFFPSIAFCQLPEELADSNIVLSTKAQTLLTAGLDTAHVERVFCLYYHVNKKVYVDSAYVPVIDSADVGHVYYSHPCPKKMATAHWHFTDLGYGLEPSEVDIANLKQFNPDTFGVIIARDYPTRRPRIHFHPYR